MDKKATGFRMELGADDSIDLVEYFGGTGGISSLSWERRLENNDVAKLLRLRRLRLEHVFQLLPSIVFELLFF